LYEDLMKNRSHPFRFEENTDLLFDWVGAKMGIPAWRV
jgi:hypothetical protein